MNEKLEQLYQECIHELKSIGIHLNSVGNIDIRIAKRKNLKRYGCCKQEKYGYVRKYHIEISEWVMLLEDSIIKNTIMHELIHCLPYCNNHGTEFKKYANLINSSLGYDIARTGNKKKDFEKSHIAFQEQENYHYKIICQVCKQEFYRKRLVKNFSRKYRCAKCGSKFEIIKLV